MKGILSALCVTAVLNILLLGGLVGWLTATNRLDLDRVKSVRELFTRTVAQQKKDDADAKAKADAEGKAREAALKAGRAPLTATEQLTARLEASALDSQRVRLLQDQVDSLKRALVDARAQVDHDRAQVAKEREQLEQARAEAAASTGDKQFQKTLNILTALKPTEARSALNEILRGTPPTDSRVAAAFPARAVSGAAGTGAAAVPPAEASNGSADGSQPDAPANGALPGKSQVLAYLDAMEERPRTKIIAEFMKTDPHLAADLLESLRMRGQVARVPGNAPT